MASICSAESLETKTSHKTWRTSTTWRNQNLNIHEQSQIPKFPTGHFWWPDFSWLSTVLPGLATPRAPLPGKTSKRQNVNQSEPPKNMICGECRWISWNRETHFQSLSGVGRPLKWQHLRLSLELFHTSCRQTGVSFLGYLNMLSILRHLPVKSSPLFSQLEPGRQQSKPWSKAQNNQPINQIETLQMNNQRLIMCIQVQKTNFFSDESGSWHSLIQRRKSAKVRYQFKNIKFKVCNSTSVAPNISTCAEDPVPTEERWIDPISKHMVSSKACTHHLPGHHPACIGHSAFRGTENTRDVDWNSTRLTFAHSSLHSSLKWQWWHCRRLPVTILVSRFTWNLCQYVASVCWA